MIPLRDDVPSPRFSVVNTALVAANVLVFLAELVAPGGVERAAWTFGAIPYEFWTGQALGLRPLDAPWTALTSMFLHGGVLHLAFNMLFLAIFGNDVEEALGSVRYLAFYLAGGVAAAAAQIVLGGPRPEPMIGASGAIAAVLGAFFVLYPQARVLALVPIFIFIEFVWLPAWVFLLGWFAIQLLSSGAGGGVAWHAHVGGFVAGVLLLWPFLPSAARAKVWRTRRYRWS